jgi:hypothetical protein
MGLLTRRTGNSTHPGPAYTSSAHAARPTHPADSYYAYPSHSTHSVCPFPTDPAEPYLIDPAGPYPIDPAGPYPTHPSSSTQPTYLSPTHSTHRAHPIYPSNLTQSTSTSYDLSSSSVDIQGVPIPAEVACPKLRTPQFTVGDLYGKRSRRTTIEVLPEDILLGIFDFYRLDDIELHRRRPWKWHHLAHVCRKWRHVLTVSPRRLGMQILCRPGGTPIESIMDAWPTLPLSVLYIYPESRSLSKNFIVALRRPDRICKIDFTLSSLLIKSIVPIMQEPFPELEQIQITVQDITGPLAIRGSFLGGSAPRVRDIQLSRVAIPFPAIRQVLSSTNSLVKLQLLNISNDVYFSPVDLVNALSTLIYLESLMISFRSPASRPPPPPPPSTATGRPRTTKRTTTLSLTYLYFRGAHEYLEEFISQIDLPSLRKITISLFNQIVFEIPHFCQFISPFKALGSPISVCITPTKEAVKVAFEHMVTSNRICSLKTLCLRLDWQLSFVTQLMTQLPPFIRSNVQFLSVGRLPNHRPHMPTGVEDVDSGQWLELFQPFRNVSRVRIWESGLVPGIVQALVTEEEEEADENVVAEVVLPELEELHLSRYDRSPSVLEDVVRFVSARRRAGRTVHMSS